MTVRLQVKMKNETKNIVVVQLEDIKHYDPVSLSIYADEAIRNSGSNVTKVAFVLKRRQPEKKVSYHYLKLNGAHITERYLFNMIHLKHFKKKGQCDNLWHGCRIPSLDEIHSYAKELRIQED